MEAQIVEPIWGRNVGRVVVQMKLENFDDNVRQPAENNLPH